MIRPLPSAPQSIATASTRDARPLNLWARDKNINQQRVCFETTTSTYSEAIVRAFWGEIRTQRVAGGYISLSARGCWFGRKLLNYVI